MHIQALEFLTWVKDSFPWHFRNALVLDVGSGDINGNLRSLFEYCQYNGNDVVAGPNVTVVSKTSELTFPPGFFFTIVSSECFEHDPEYEKSFAKIVELLMPGGLFAFTCATLGRPEHGTRRTSPGDSFGTLANLPEMQDYYKNIVPSDLPPLKKHFINWGMYVNSHTKDLYFVGRKIGGEKKNVSTVSWSRSISY